MSQLQTGISAAAADRIALRWYAVPAVVVGLVALAWFVASGAPTIGITGELSIARIAIYGTLVAGILVFGYAYRYGQINRGAWQKLNGPTRALDITTLTISHAVVVVALVALLCFVLTNAFKGLMFDPYTAALLVSAMVGMASYALIILALNINIGQIVAMLAVVLIGGVLLAMVTNQQANWWQINFSYLGSADSANSLAFNLTLVFSGLMMVALSRFVFDQPKQLYGKSAQHIKILEGLFIATALALAGVGLFPYTPDTILVYLHNWSATLLVVFILAMIVGLRWYVPSISREFTYTSYMIALVLTIMVWLFQGIGYLSLTAFELSAFGVSFVWLVLLMRNLQLLPKPDPARQEQVVPAKVQAKSPARRPSVVSI
ncbi:DUF998 domain-containing protein [Patescibacteria group bacterium]|nr:MAG: DUF998 domain-containing protein [Patescibacteria group bacterium]